MFPTQFTSASFTWERKKLGDVANSYINGGTPDTQNKNYWIGDIPWIQSSDLKNDDIWNVNINKYITNKAVNDSAAKLIPANSIAIVTRVGVGKLAYMSQEYSTSQDFLSLVDIKEDLIFIMYMLYFKISKVSSSLQGTSIKGITKKELLNLSISIVNNTAEQNRIGQVFKILDNSINLHGYYHLKHSGVMAIVLPHGILFRGAAEGKIRKKLLENGAIDAVIGLPANLFYNTSIPTTIVVLKKDKQDRDVLFIDASKDFEKVKTQNELRDEDVEKILTTYKERKDIDKYAHLASFDEIKENEFNLNIPRYVDTFEPEPEINLDEVSKELRETNEKIKENEIELISMLKDLTSKDEKITKGLNDFISVLEEDVK